MKLRHAHAHMRMCGCADACDRACVFISRSQSSRLPKLITISLINLIFYFLLLGYAIPNPFPS